MTITIKQLKVIIESLPKPSNTHPTKMPSTCKAEYHQMVGRLVVGLLDIGEHNG